MATQTKILTFRCTEQFYNWVNEEAHKNNKTVSEWLNSKFNRLMEYEKAITRSYEIICNKQQKIDQLERELSRHRNGNDLFF